MIQQTVHFHLNLHQNLKLLFLSATPKYNSHEEILWLLNIMNINDGRPPIIKKEIFDNYGNFVVTDSEEVGKMRLTQVSDCDVRALLLPTCSD